jgi:L-lactate dehydrogenase complex protein LldG
MEESTSREKVLKKVRHALIYKTDNPFPHVDFDSPVYKPMGDTPDVNFAQEFTKAGGVFLYCENEAEAAAALSALNIECKWQNIYCAEPELQYLLTRFRRRKSSTVKRGHHQLRIPGIQVGKYYGFVEKQP